MGCWNGTCMISNLPINSGEKIKLVILQKSMISGIKSLFTSGYVYPTDFLTPAFLPISGKYNDYGNIEGIEQDWNYNLIEKHLQNKFGNKIKVDDDIVEN